MELLAELLPQEDGTWNPPAYLSVPISGCERDRVPAAAGRARRAPVPVRGGAAGAADPTTAAATAAGGRRAGRGQPTAPTAAAATATTAAGTGTATAAAAWTAGTMMMRDTALAATSVQGGPTEFHPGRPNEGRILLGRPVVHIAMPMGFVHVTRYYLLALPDPRFPLKPSHTYLVFSISSIFVCNARSISRVFSGAFLPEKYPYGTVLNWFYHTVYAPAPAP